MKTPTAPPNKKPNRGQIWVIGQLILGFFVLIAGALVPTGFFWPGVIVVLLGGGLAVLASTDLGRNLSVFPKPKDDAFFVQRGLYRWVRHPIYSGLLLAGLGWSVLWLSWAAFLVWIVFLIWMDRKAALEEVWLVGKYENYAEYRGKVKKFFPFLY